MYKNALDVILLIAYIIIASVVFAPTARAADTSCTSHSNYFDGYYHEPSTHSNTFEGASGYIVNQFANTCDDDHSSPSPAGRTIGSNFTAVLVMIAAYDLHSWSQVGVISGYDLNQYFWAQVWLRGSKYTPDENYDRFLANGALTYGGRHAYTEKYVSYCLAPTNHACEESFVDSTRVTDTDFDPVGNFQNGGYPPRWSPQYNGETTYQNSQIEGNTTNHTHFTFIGAQQWSDDSLLTSRAPSLLVDHTLHNMLDVAVAAAQILIFGPQTESSFPKPNGSNANDGPESPLQACS